MGYTTEFIGSFDVVEPVDKDFYNYINRFARSRRMKRDPKVIKTTYPNWYFMCFDGKLGNEGEYFVNNMSLGQVNENSVVDYNRPPVTQPGLWCQWQLSTKDDATEGPFECSLVWDGGEKFYFYTEWLSYLITHFFEPKGYHLSGCVLAVGEEEGDASYIVADNNEVFVFNYDNSLNDILSVTTDVDVIAAINDCYKDCDQIREEYWYYED